MNANTNIEILNLTSWNGFDFSISSNVSVSTKASFNPKLKVTKINEIYTTRSDGIVVINRKNYKFITKISADQSRA